jgi:hypothetical protein
MDNLAGHKTQGMVIWMFSQGIMPLYTPLSGSWLNMAESIQRIIKRRALECQHLETADEIIVSHRESGLHLTESFVANLPLFGSPA